MEDQVVCPKCSLPGEKLKTEESHWKCIRCNYLFKITVDMYREALSIYLKHAYPDSHPLLIYHNMDEVRRIKMDMLDNPIYFSDGIPKESRMGCHNWGHMKLRIIKDAFVVDCNDFGESPSKREVNTRIKEKIEAEWLHSNLPVIR